MLVIWINLIKEIGAGGRRSGREEEKEEENWYEIVSILCHS